MHDAQTIIDVEHAVALLVNGGFISCNHDAAEGSSIQYYFLSF